MFFTSALKDIAKSILLYLHDEACAHRSFAVDLGARGFHIWQNYIDAMDLLRSLFRLSTTHPNSPAHDKDAQRNLTAMARTGVLLIAAKNTPLFISTISLDIMDSTSVSDRNSTMQLVAFIIRKAINHVFWSQPFTDVLSLSETDDLVSESSPSGGSCGQVTGPELVGQTRSRS